MLETHIRHCDVICLDIEYMYSTLSLMPNGYFRSLRLVYKASVYSESGKMQISNKTIIEFGSRRI